MHSTIHLLPEDLINKIAAGEVIERPASVVKELVENSIDAGATRIKVEIQDAGRKLIRVSDNGRGMDREDLKLSIQRHSTSKINKLDDLFNIQSLGFRGEALPSIASVSKLEIISSADTLGSCLRTEGGKEITIEDAGVPRGTTVSVKNLFFNTPARKKFLKSPPTEMGHIGDIVSKYALAEPEISFELFSDGKPLLLTPGTGRLADAVVSIYGADLIKGLVENEVSFGSGKVYGLVSRPTLSRIDKTYEIFFVNRRYVRNFLLNRALEEACRALIPGNRYPVAVLFIDIDPKQVDVNVHPAKREVKFVNTSEVMQAVRDFVKSALSNKSSGEDRRAPMPAAREWEPAMADFLFAGEKSFPSFLHEVPRFTDSSLPLVPIYQHKNTYIVCTDGEELVLIDQHAAHERVLYDLLSRRDQKSIRQPLLLPENIELSPKEKATLEKNLAQMNEYGFEIEAFGGNTFIIRSIPSLSSKVPAKQLLLDLISDLTSMEVKEESVRKLIACHSAIKAGDKLSGEEINQLIRDLYSTENPLTCPHGRPTMIKVTEEELKKRFGR